MAQPVTQFDTDALHLLITDMLDTMQAANGAGLAAPQIGVDLQLVIFGTDARQPALSGRAADSAHGAAQSGDHAAAAVAGDASVVGEEDWEGCLSVPGLRAVVPRHARVRYTGFDQYGDPIERTVEGFHARVVQHECDHLIGVLYPMRVRDFSRFGFTEVLFPGLDARRTTEAFATPAGACSGQRLQQFGLDLDLRRGCAAAPRRRSGRCRRPVRPASRSWPVAG